MGKRPLRVWFSGYWDPNKDPQHCTKAVVRYNPLSKAGAKITPMLQSIQMLLEAERKGTFDDTT